MNNNMSHDESEDLPPMQGTYNNRIEDHITLLLEGISIDELSAYEREQLATKYCGLLLRLLPLLREVESRSMLAKEISMLSIIGEPKIIPGIPTPVRVATPEDVED